MKLIKLNEIGEEHVFSDIIGIAQAWETVRSWAFLDPPRPNHGLMYIVSGYAVFTDGEGNTVRYDPGDVFYLPKGVRYSAEFHRGEDPYVDYLINFDLRTREGEDCAFSDRILLLLNGKQPKIADDFYKLCRFSHRLSNPYLPVHRIFFSLLEKLQTFHTLSDLNGKVAQAIAPALLYMDSHVGENIPVSHLAKLCLMSETAFRRAFREQTGMSPVQYKIHSRINKAKVLLQSSEEIAIEEIAESLGFYDLSYFYKTFVSFTGTTPSRFRSGGTP